MGPTVLPTGRAAPCRRRRQTVATSWRSLASSERRWRVRGTGPRFGGLTRRHSAQVVYASTWVWHLGSGLLHVTWGAIGRQPAGEAGCCLLSVYIHLVEAQPRRPRCTQHSIDQLRCRWRVTCWQVRPSVGTPCFESCRAGTLRRQTTARSCTLPVYCVYMYLGSLQAAAGGGVYLYLHGGAWTWPGLAPAPTRSYTHSWAGQNRLPSTLFRACPRSLQPRSLPVLIPVAVHHKNDAVHTPPIRRPAGSCSSLHRISARSLDLGKCAPGSSGTCLATPLAPAHDGLPLSCGPN